MSKLQWIDINKGAFNRPKAGHVVKVNDEEDDDYTLPVYVGAVDGGHRGSIKSDEYQGDITGWWISEKAALDLAHALTKAVHEVRELRTKEAA